MVKARGGREHQEVLVQTFELTVIVTTHTRLADLELHRSQHKDEKADTKMPPLTEELLVFDICRESESQFSLMM